MSNKEFSPNIEDVTLPFPRAMFIPTSGDKIIFRKGMNLKVCHSYNPPDCFNCKVTSCKFSGEKGKQLEKFWKRLVEYIG